MIDRPSQGVHFITCQLFLGGLGSGANREARLQTRSTFQTTHTTRDPVTELQARTLTAQRTPACHVPTITCPKVLLGSSRRTPLVPCVVTSSALGARQAELRWLGASANATQHSTLAVQGSAVRSGHSAMASSGHGRRSIDSDQRRGDQSPLYTQGNPSDPYSPLACSSQRIAHPTQPPVWTYLRGISATSDAALERCESYQIDGSTQLSVSTRPVHLARYTSDRHISNSPPGTRHIALAYIYHGHRRRTL